LQTVGIAITAAVTTVTAHRAAYSPAHETNLSLREPTNAWTVNQFST